MRTAKQIDNEIKKLEKLRVTPGEHGGFRFNLQTRDQIAAQIKVLSSRMKEQGIEREWFVDETSDEFKDGDNETYHEAMRALRWMRGDKGEAAPSAQ